MSDEPQVDQVRARLVITPHDHKVIGQYLLKGSRNVAARRWRAAWSVLGFLVGALLALAALADRRTLILYVAILLMLAVQNRMRLASFPSMADLLQGELIVDRTGFGLQRANGSSYWYPWEAILEVTPTVDHVLIREFDMVGMVIPRRCLAPGDAERIMALATDALSWQVPRS